MSYLPTSWRGDPVDHVSALQHYLPEYRVGGAVRLADLDVVYIDRDVLRVASVKLGRVPLDDLQVRRVSRCLRCATDLKD